MTIPESIDKYQILYSNIVIDDRLTIPILIHAPTKYINVTKMIDSIPWIYKNKGNISSYTWQFFDSTKQMITHLEKDIDTVATFNYNNGPEEFCGMYMHKFLIPHLLSWLSPKIALSISATILDKYSL